MLATLLLPLLGLGLVAAMSSFEEDLVDVVEEGAQDLLDDPDLQSAIEDITDLFGFNTDSGDDGDDTLSGSEGDDALTDDTATDDTAGDDIAADDIVTDGADTGDAAPDDTVTDGTGQHHDCCCDDKGDQMADKWDKDEDPVADPDPVVDPDPVEAELLQGTGENDTLQGGPGNDTLLGEAGDDLLEGNDGDDSVLGASGDDLLSGNAGNDVIEAGDGADLAQGGEGDDIITGYDLPVIDGEDAGASDSAADVLDGGAGNDTLTGNDGDTIMTGDGEDVVRVLGLDQIGQSAVVVTDFDPAEDVLVLVDRQGQDVDFGSDDDASDTFDPATVVEIRAASDGAGTEVIYGDQVIALLQGTDVDLLQSETAWLANSDALVLVQLNAA